MLPIIFSLSILCWTVKVYLTHTHTHTHAWTPRLRRPLHPGLTAWSPPRRPPRAPLRPGSPARLLQPGATSAAGRAPRTDRFSVSGGGEACFRAHLNPSGSSYQRPAPPPAEDPALRAARRGHRRPAPARPPGCTQSLPVIRAA